jgi:RNA polymerase sigma-70 factor (ECF subfamily)
MALSRFSSPRVISGVSDAELVAGLRRGDPRAFEAVYHRFRPAIFGFLVRLCRRREVAEELLQETWLRLASGAPALPETTRLAAWLFTVARHLAVSHRRRSLLGAERLVALALALSGGGGGHDPLAHAEASEAQRRAERAVAALPLKFREIILLVAVQRFEPAEAAQILGIRPDAARQRLARARALMAKHMMEEDHGR